MTTKFILLAILAMTIVFVEGNDKSGNSRSSHMSNFNFDRFFNKEGRIRWSKNSTRNSRPSSTDFKVQFTNRQFPSNIPNKLQSLTAPTPSVSGFFLRQNQKLTKQNLWKVFSYLNKYYQPKDSRCQANYKNSTETGCCIRGNYYEEERCWIALLSITVFATTFFVGGLLCCLSIFFILCCVGIKRCYKKKFMKMLLKKKAALLAAKNGESAQNPSAATTENIPNQTVQRQAPVIQPNNSSSINSVSMPKCNCPKKHPSKPQTNTLSTTSNDFGYLPPKLNEPLIRPKPQPSHNVNVELENKTPKYPIFEEVEVNNPYPKFNFIRNSNFIFLNSLDVPVVQSACNYSKNNCHANNVFDINKY